MHSHSEYYKGKICPAWLVLILQFFGIQAQGGFIQPALKAVSSPCAATAQRTSHARRELFCLLFPQKFFFLVWYKRFFSLIKCILLSCKITQLWCTLLWFFSPLPEETRQHSRLSYISHYLHTQGLKTYHCSTDISPSWGFYWTNINDCCFTAVLDNTQERKNKQLIQEHSACKNQYSWLKINIKNSLPCCHTSDVTGAQNTQLRPDLSPMSHLPANLNFSCIWWAAYTWEAVSPNQQIGICLKTQRH